MNGGPSTTHLRLRWFYARLAVVALACALALSTFVSALAIAELHDHECAGDDCPICLVLELSQAALLLAASDSSVAFSAALVLASTAIAFAVRSCALIAETPVSLKVRLVI